MTQEEKAKAYDIALDKIKMLLGTGNSCSREELMYVFPELKESEDERIRKEIISYLKTRKGYTEAIKDPWIAWLEKQGGQKPADKVEPKFKVGDWVIDVQGVSSNQIIGYEDDSYYIETSCSKFYLPMKLAEKNYRLWTIQDAKDGDVLVSPLPKGYEGGEQIFIFERINSRDYVDDCIEYYCRVCKNVFYENENKNGYMGTTSYLFYPATKEQRELLFQKMHEAGYEWDAEKKELGKISQRIISAEAKEAMYDKPAWSEEDKTVLNNLIYALANDRIGNNRDEYVDWLKSLRPQNHWKPDELQLECLSDAISDYNKRGYEAPILK